MARYGHKRAAARLRPACSTPAVTCDLRRLPELFCGFARPPRRGADALSGRLLAAGLGRGRGLHAAAGLLGLEVDAPARQVRFRHPRLPDFLDDLSVTGLRVGDASLDLAIGRQPLGVDVRVVRRRGDVEVIDLK